MAEIGKQIMKCPRCGKEIEVAIWDSINMPYDNELKESIMKNTFFSVACDECGARAPIVYRCEYNDIDKRYMIMTIPGTEEDMQNEIAQYNKRMKDDKALYFARAGYTQRIVCNSNELREKILIFDEDLDDRYIETMKFVYYTELRKSLAKDCEIVGIFLEKHAENEYHWVVIFNNRQPATLKINMNMYKDMKTRIKEEVEAATPEGICRIHGGWAVNVMLKSQKSFEEE